MKAIVLGDIGWASQYHVGDEAMTEAAIQQLRSRGFDDIVVVSGEPDVGAALYNCAGVARIGYHRPWSRERLETTKDTLVRAFGDPASATAPMRPLIEAVRTADLAVIAGGGNLNSEHAYHLFERWSFARIAHEFSIPLIVLSQTVGPHLDERDAAMVRDILGWTTFVGAREQSTFRLLSSWSSSGTVIRTMDDAILLIDASRTATTVTDQPYIVASFTDHPAAEEISDLDYPSVIAAMLDRVADEQDVNVVLIPHVGSLQHDVVKADEALNERILAASSSGRLTALPMARAREVVAVTGDALASVSTRYHQAVFSAAAGVPSLTIASSEYDYVRMHGAYENLGLEGHVLPSLALIDGAAATAVGRLVQDSPNAHRAMLRERSAIRDREQHEIWDAILASVHNGDDRVDVTSLSELDDAGHLGLPPATALSASRLLWATRTRMRESDSLHSVLLRDRETQISELNAELSSSQTRADRAEREVHSLQAKNSAASEQIFRLSRALHSSQNRRVARLANSLAAAARLLLPPWRPSRPKSTEDSSR